MAIVFPTTPAVGTVYPANPGVSGSTQYKWDGTKWNAVLTSVSLGSANQGAYNSYQWPTSDGTVGQQLTTDGAGNLVWAVSATAALEVLALLESFNGILTAFTLVKSGTTTPFSPNPSSNIIVFLGGVPQIPVAAYQVTGNTITFQEPPLPGSTFYAISSTIV